MPRYFEDLEVGDAIETPARTITEADVVRYAGVSGDQEILDFAATDAGLPPLVPDLLVMIITSGLGFRAPTEIPQVLAFMVFDLHVRLPVRIGDTIRCRIRVAGKRPMKDGGVIVEQREMVNQRGDVVQEAEYKLLVARRPRE
ncbi:MAG TPA: MaoC/PaaZ C-terminal domain-containing protein [Methylomirabilota bacterium]|jgi:acyl dehydratase|nr:MaoC/PaaZ C-terminal domain-containing protein [Methylomirabilota bacterium]